MGCVAQTSGPALLDGEVAAVDEYEVAGVKADRPPPGGTRKFVFPDPNGMTACLTEIIDYDSGHFGIRSGVHPHPSTNSNPICGAVVVV